MKNLIQTYALGAGLAVLGLSLFPQAALADFDTNRVSYIDSVSSSYLYNQPVNKGGSSIDMNSIEASFKLDNKPIITNKKVKVKLSLRDSDVKEALRMLADKAGINIVFDNSISGKITLDLNNIDINDAFMIIFKTMQFTYVMDNNTLTVMTLEAYKNLGYIRQNMTVIPIKYVNAENVASFLNDNLFTSNIFGLSNRSIVTSNPTSNQIIVFGSNADVMAIKRILPVIDVKPSITNIKINHTTPKEMATLICDSLFYNSGETGTSKSEESSSDSSDEITLGGGVIACRDVGDSDGGSDSSDNLSPFKANPLTVTYFTDLGRLSLVGGSPEKIDLIKNFVKENDRKQLMAYIEISVISLNEDGSKEFTNAWNLWTPFISLGFENGTLFTRDESPLFLWGNKYVEGARSRSTNGGAFSEQVEYYRTNNKAIQYKLKYVIENNNGRVLTNPKFMVTNGRKATIKMNSDYVDTSKSEVMATGGMAGATQKTFSKGSDQGITIEMVPFISPDGYVSMNLKPKFVTFLRTEDDGNGGIGATLNSTREVDLKNIRIRDGETMVLAGLIDEHESQNTAKMPLLSDLPFIGVFFRNQSSKKVREELVIVVTPHIIKDGDMIDNNIYDL